MTELQRQSTPEVVREWIAAIPSWLEIHLPITPELEVLGLGERQAICLAQELRAAAIIIDEERGRKEAKKRGLSVMGFSAFFETPQSGSSLNSSQRYCG